MRVTASSSLAAAISLAIVAVTSSPMTVSAEPTDVRPTDAQYFIDFRSRAGYVFGHTYMCMGRLNMRAASRSALCRHLSARQWARPRFRSVIPVAASVRGLEEDRKAARRMSIGGVSPRRNTPGSACGSSSVQPSIRGTCCFTIATTSLSKLSNGWDCVRLPQCWCRGRLLTNFGI